MALTDFQRTICRLLADHRISSGESYVAGGVALNEIMATSRISRDIDLFHDTVEALEASWAADRRLLEAHGFAVRVLRERPSYVEVQAFESAPGQSATLDAVWTVARTKDGRSRTGRTTVREPAPQPGYEALAAAHSRAIARLSRDIADAVGALDRAR